MTNSQWSLQVSGRTTCRLVWNTQCSWAITISFHLRLHIPDRNCRLQVRQGQLPMCGALSWLALKFSRIIRPCWPPQSLDRQSSCTSYRFCAIRKRGWRRKPLIRSRSLGKCVSHPAQSAPSPFCTPQVSAWWCLGSSDLQGSFYL